MAGETDEKGFKVVDRRSFNADGSERTGPPDEAGAARTPAAPEGSVGAAPSSGEAPRHDAELDFTTFVLSLGSSVLVHLGELAPPGEGAQHRDLPLAKQTIDILGMLSEKTRGNLSSDEASLIEHLLYDLRLKYVEAKRK